MVIHTLQSTSSYVTHKSNQLILNLQGDSPSLGAEILQFTSTPFVKHHSPSADRPPLWKHLWCGILIKMKNCSLLVLINIPRGYLPKQQHRPSTVCHPPGSAYFIPNLRLMKVLMIKTAIIIKGLSRSPSNGAFPSRRAIIKLGYRCLIMSHGILTERMTTLWLWYLAYKIRFYSLFQPRDRPLHNIIILPREPSPIGTYILAISSS